MGPQADLNAGVKKIINRCSSGYSIPDFRVDQTAAHSLYLLSRPGPWTTSQSLNTHLARTDGCVIADPNKGKLAKQVQSCRVISSAKNAKWNGRQRQQKHERCCTTLQTVQSWVRHKNRNTTTPVHSAVSTDFFPFQAGFRSTQVLLIGSYVIVCVMKKWILMLLEGFHYMTLRKLGVSTELV